MSGYYDINMTAQARACVMVAVVGELERMRDRQSELEPTDHLGRRVLRDGIADLQDALDSLRAAIPTDVDRMPEAAIQRTLSAIKKETRS